VWFPDEMEIIEQQQHVATWKLLGQNCGQAIRVKFRTDPFPQTVLYACFGAGRKYLKRAGHAGSQCSDIGRCGRALVPGSRTLSGFAPLAG
jgi:hypothetical protein